VQLGENYLNAGEASFGFNIDRNTTSLVADFNTVVLVELNLNGAAVAAQRLIDRVVNDFPKTVHETTRVGRADIHTGTLTDSFQSFQNGKMASGIL
jgi:hypothetical protein